MDPAGVRKEPEDQDADQFAFFGGNPDFLAGADEAVVKNLPRIAPFRFEAGGFKVKQGWQVGQVPFADSHLG
jgi:hypothetical protein